MAAAGLTWVRIGEFAWSRLEPAPGDLRLDWLDRAIETLGGAGLKVVLGTPTATPPRWMLDRHPDMLAWDIEGRPRGFGSRRHYDFSHAGYRDECARITRILAERYGANPHVAAWQTDNEYACHDTAHSFSPVAAEAFRAWLAARYGDVAALNVAWGNVFWSMDYASFDAIALPNLTVTVANPAHWLDFRRFASDQVVAFNRIQTEIIRAASPAPILHNYMGRITEFDHSPSAPTSTPPLGTATRSAFSRTAPTRASPGRQRSSARATPTSRPSTTTSTARSAAAAGG